MDLVELRSLAAAIYPSARATGYGVTAAVHHALDVAEALIAESEARAAARSARETNDGGPRAGLRRA